MASFDIVRWARRFGVVKALALAGLGVVVVFNLTRITPFYMWDMLPYVGVAYSYTEDSPERIHSLTYETARRVLPPKQYQKLTNNIGGFDYREPVAINPQYFQNILPWYTVKPFYPAAIFLLGRFGVDPITASVAISMAAYVGIAVVILLWFTRITGFVPATVLSALLISFQPVLDLARHSTPDPSSSFITLVCLFLLAEKRAVRTAVVLSVLSLLVRPDNLPMTLLVAIWVGVLHRERMAWAIGGFVGGGASFLALTKLAGSYSWQVMYQHTYVFRLLEPQLYVPTRTLDDYLDIYAEMVTLLVHTPMFSLILAIAILATIVRITRTGLLDSYVALLVTTVGFMVGHWLAIPIVNSDRNMAGYYAVVAIALVRIAVTGLRDSRFTHRSKDVP